MADTTPNVIAFPPDLIAAAEQYARETNKSVSDVAQEALRFYVDADPELNALRRYHKEQAALLGLSPDEYVMHLVKQSRAENRLRSA